MKINFNLNGKEKTFETEPNEKVLDFLRRIGLKGVKRGCETGDCGACAIILDDKIVNSCMLYTGQIDGHSITTIEGLGDNQHPHLIQKTFVEEGAVQCGFCTPGMILATKVLLDKNPNPTLKDIKDALSGNLCRCTGYVKIEKAVIESAKKLGGKNV